jgi:endonuclease III
MAPKPPAALRRRAQQILAALHKEYPEAKCALNFTTPWELLVATILSAQCTDEKVNQVTATLFKRYRGPQAFLKASREGLEQAIHATGFFRNKTKSLQGAALAVIEHYDGQVPRTMEEMLIIPGVQRKTANVVLGSAYGLATGVTVDTHVSRLAVRMGLTPPQATKSINTDKIEQDLMALYEQDQWIALGHCLIWHGRRICTAKKALCESCVVDKLCPKIGL